MSWRGEAAGDGTYAVRLSRGRLDVRLEVTARPTGQSVPGVPRAADHSGWSSVDGAGGQLSVVPWVTDRTGLSGRLDTAQWRSFGALLAGVHGVDLPAELRAIVPVEDYRPRSAAAVRALGERVRTGTEAGDEVAAALVEAWRSAADRIAALPAVAEEVRRALALRRFRSLVSPTGIVSLAHAAGNRRG